MEQLHTEQLTATAYKARVTAIYTGLHNFSDPTEHTRHMLILRALTFSTDPTTQSRTAKMLKACMATPHDQVNGLREHVRQHGTPPAVSGVEDMASIAGSPGVERLGTIEGPSIYEACLKNLFNMIIEVNARARTQGMGTQAAMETYKTTKPGTSYADTSVIEEDAWQALCQVYGTRRPKTDQAPQAVRGLSRPRQDKANTHQAAAPHREDHHDRALHAGCCDGGGIGNGKRRNRSANGQDADSK